MGATNRQVGLRGEQLASDWYESRGYEILDRNWRCGQGELDVVALRGTTLVFCEVKARTGTGFGLPAEAVTAAKQARIRRLAARWMADHRERHGRRYRSVRFDVAAVLGGDVDVIEAAF